MVVVVCRHHIYLVNQKLLYRNEAWVQAMNRKEGYPRYGELPKKKKRKRHVRFTPTGASRGLFPHVKPILRAGSHQSDV
jgi:hypothetical protein